MKWFCNECNNAKSTGTPCILEVDCDDEPDKCPYSSNDIANWRAD